MKHISTPAASKHARTVALLLASALAGLLLNLTGCGSGANSKSTTDTGRFALTVQWPPPTRLIPAASGSINAVLTSAGTTVAHQLLVRPAAAPWTSTVTFNNLKPGPVTLSANAYPNADGTGVAQATGAMPATINAGAQTSVTVNLTSTIDHLAISPAAPTVAAGASTTLMETAFDAAGNVVLTAPQNLSWLSGTTANATVTAAGVATGFQTGTSLITVTESESGKSATATLTVTAAGKAPPTGPYLAGIDPTGKFVYIADNLTKTISQFKINADGRLTPLTPATVAVGHSPNAITVNPTSGSHNLYLGTNDGGTGAIYEFNINPDGTLAPLSQGSVPLPGYPINLLIDPSGKHLYSIGHSGGIRAFVINPDGSLIQNGPDFLDTNYQFYSGAISPDGSTLYASAIGGTQSNSGLRIDHINADGTLTNISSVNDFGIGLTVAPSGPFLMVENGTGITTYRIGTNGALSKVAGTPTPVSEPLQAVITPNGKNLYAVSTGSLDSVVSQYAIGTDGSLTPLSPATVPAGNEELAIVVTSDGKYVYVLNYTDNTVSQFQINANGTLTPLSPAAIPG